jgi:4-hydroxy-tetrahydrodipicolinate synthase
MSVFSVLPTPFDASGDFDPDSLRRVIDLFLADGVRRFTALGVTSEVARLTDRERDVALDTVMTHVRRRGAITTPAVRPPGGTLDQTTMAALDRVMNWVSAT